jgi:hypothetical protein
MLIQIDENPNCGPLEARVFQERSPAQVVTSVRQRRGNERVWCSVTGLDEDMHPIPAQVQKVEDSGEGTCYLVTGGAWGLRLKTLDSSDPWSLENPAQWGEPFLLMAPDETDLRCA